MLQTEKLNNSVSVHSAMRLFLRQGSPRAQGVLPRVAPRRFRAVRFLAVLLLTGFLRSDPLFLSAAVSTRSLLVILAKSLCGSEAPCSCFLGKFSLRQESIVPAARKWIHRRAAKGEGSGKEGEQKAQRYSCSLFWGLGGLFCVCCQAGCRQAGHAAPWGLVRAPRNAEG